MAKVTIVTNSKGSYRAVNLATVTAGLVKSKVRPKDIEM